MSRLDNLMEKASQDSEEEEKSQTSSVSTSVGLSNLGFEKDFDITTEGPFTQSGYLCCEVECDNETCDEPILHVIQPQYDLQVGISNSIPIELIFSRNQHEIVEDRDIGLWSKHKLATDRVAVFECPECGEENEFVLCEDEGLLVLTSQYDNKEVPVPKARMKFINNPRDEWSDNVMDD